MKLWKQVFALCLGLTITVAVMAEEDINPLVTDDASRSSDTAVLEESSSADNRLFNIEDGEASIAAESEQLLESPEASAGSIMGTLAHDLSPYGMYQAADWVVKSVMILLLAASIVTWAIWMAKWLQLASARKQLNKLLAQVITQHRFDEASQLQFGEASAGRSLIEATEQELKMSRDESAWVDEGIKQRISSRLESIQNAEATSMTTGMGVLATVGSVAPFVGLFGTVWGIMNAFIGIAQSQTTNLAVVAPGIAEALLATAMGLVAAIPAVVIYNHFTRKISAYRSMLGNLSTSLLILVSRDLDRQSSFSQADIADVSMIKKAAVGE
ncbi:motA/TolQ/ExbB proton channel family protein [Methylophaga lonarensis MPL]|uniref:Biopolymer transport protein ExbB n=1 Tax=Methylophaga lonarensis MPL TaxID=1286106 RepID=M7P163_9GAMM|nr:tonB-system energizer ExbB [Methylophaga lonarensis]EMR13202.1 motA/TolQ/ExbB proton channel family protein [Methylophaga lonarensis MPL]